MPSGQSGRTLWNVPKLSNRFQVLRATGQPPTITPLCVSCVIGLPAQQSKHRHFSSKRERAELTKWMPVFVYCKIFLIIGYLLLLLVHSEPGASSLTGQSHMWLKLRHNLHLSTARVPPCFIPPPPRLERQTRSGKTGRWSWAIPLPTLMEITQELPG